MKIERYVAGDMRQALKLVRDSLGPDAVILSSKKTAGGVEILASAQYQNLAPTPALARGTAEPALAAANGAGLQPARGEQSQNQAPRPMPAQASQVPNDGSFEAVLQQYQHASAPADQELMFSLRSEIENLRLLLRDQLKQSSRDRWTLGNPLAAQVHKRLQQCGLADSLARRLALQSSDHVTTEEAWQACLAALEAELPLTAPDPVLEGGILALAGPTGAGKTTTIAKLAVRYALVHGRDRLALVTTDDQRLAAYDQLRTLARILDVPVRRIDERNSLASVLHGFRDKALVLIDMPGFAPEGGADLLRALKHCYPAAKTWLVLPSSSQQAALEASYQQAAAAGVDAAVISKTDETGSFGEVLSLILEKALPLAYITNGQAIPEDIQCAQAHQLLQRLLAGLPRPATQRPKSMTNLFAPAPSAPLAGFAAGARTA